MRVRLVLAWGAPVGGPQGSKTPYARVLTHRSEDVGES